MLNFEQFKSEAAFRPMIVYGILAIELILSVLIGLGLMALGLNGAAWILGGIAAGAIVFSSYRVLTHESIQPNRNARKFGQLLIGLTIGLSLQHHNLTVLSSQLLIFLGLPVFLMLAGAAIGLIYAQLEKTDLLTALLATTPGNIGVMASIAADYSKNTALVSLVQLMRFTTVIFVMPLIASVTVADAANNALSAFVQKAVMISWHELWISGFVIAVTLVAVYFGSKLKIPLAAFLCAIAVGLVLDVLPFVLPASAQFDFQLPIAVNVIGQILLGVTIGEYWGMNPRMHFSTIARAVVPVGLMLLTGLLSAGIVQRLTGWDWLTCLLVTAPGGSPEMIWIALTLHQDIDIVTAGHVIRLLAINLSLPLLLALVTTLDSESSDEVARMPQNKP